MSGPSTNFLPFFKDPRSHAQIAANQENEVELLVEGLLNPPTRNSVFAVDIIEARKIGLDECQKNVNYNFIVMKCMIGAHTKYALFKETTGWNRNRGCWLDTFQLAYFPMQGHTNITLKIKYGNRRRGMEHDPEFVYFATDARYKLRISSAYRGNRLLMKPTWVLGEAGACIRISIQIVEKEDIPDTDNFLPYSQWPPMILHSQKTRLDLMIEEEKFDEEAFAGVLGKGLISYNPATLPRILGVCSGDFNQDFLLGLGILLGAPLIDRTGTLSVNRFFIQQNLRLKITEFKLNIFNLFPIPPYKNIFPKNALTKRHTWTIPDPDHKWASMQLSNIMLERARDLLDFSLEKRKALMVL